MDLKHLKRINNTQELPGFVGGVNDVDTSKLSTLTKQTGWEKFKTRWNEGGGLKAMTALTTGLTAAQQFNSMKYPSHEVGDFIGKYGVNTNGSIDGIGYQQYNDIDTAAEENRMALQRDSKIMSGATLGGTTGFALGTAAGSLLGAGAGTAAAATAGTAAAAGGAAGAGAGLGLGAWLGPIGAIAGLGLGALLGGVFGNKGKHEEEERMRIAQIRLNNANEFWRTGALSTALRNRALEEYGDTTNQNLYSSALGSENIHTSNGIRSGKPNAKVNDGEIIESKNGKAHRVNGNPNVIDGEYARLHDGDNVYSSILTIPGTNITYAQAYPYMKAAGREDELLALQPISREMALKQRYNGGLYRAWGGLENILATAPGFILSWMDYNSAADDDIHRTLINPYNRYEGRAADLMAGRRMSAYPQMRAITQSEGSLRYRTNQSGGLSAMLKTMANLTNNMGSKIARANALANVQQINNEFAKENATLLNLMGTSLMDARMRAGMFNEQQNAAAHASKVLQMNMAKRNALDYVTQFAKNAWERDQFDRMYDLYATQVAIDAKNAGIGKDNKNKPSLTPEQIRDFRKSAAGSFSKSIQAKVAPGMYDNMETFRKRNSDLGRLNHTFRKQWTFSKNPYSTNPYFDSSVVDIGYLRSIPFASSYVPTPMQFNATPYDWNPLPNEYTTVAVGNKPYYVRKYKK